MNCPCQTDPSNSLESPAGTGVWPTVLPDAATLADWHKQFMPPAPPPPPDPSRSTCAAELCEVCHISLKPKAAALLGPDDTPQQFYQRLVAEECWADARRILAHAMPKRRAIWWGCLVAADVNRYEPAQEIEIVLPVVWRFVTDPTEENRRAAAVTGKLVPVNTLAGSLAMAAFCSGGSVSLPQLPPVHPRPFVTGRLVGVVVYLASVTRDAAHYKDHLRHYLGIGEDVARGKLLWTGVDRLETMLRCDAADTVHKKLAPHGAVAESEMSDNIGSSVPSQVTSVSRVQMN